MVDLSISQYNLVYNMLSLVIAAMGASFLFFLCSSSLVSKPYRVALYVSATVVLIACYHYVRIYNSWVGAYDLEKDVYVASGEPFNDAYRYVDWLLTVPLLMVELVAVLNLKWDLAKGLLTQLVSAAFLMILLGYPGEIATDTAPRIFFWCASMIPFLFIMYTLYFRLGDAIGNQPSIVKSYVSTIRNLTLIAWSFYPIAFLFNEFKDTGAGIAAVQIGYSLADIIAKCGYGIIIYWIARAKTDIDTKATLTTH